jgi:enoyl-CoA hydratase
MARIFSLGIDVPDVLPSWASGNSPFEAHHVNPFGTTGPKRRKPLIVVVQGQCFNAGLELALAADIVIGADNARFAFHEIHFGVHPYGGGLFRMIRAAGWNAAMRYSLTGAEFSAADAPFVMNAASRSRSSTDVVRPSLVRRHNISSGKRAHSFVMR